MEHRHRCGALHGEGDTVVERTTNRRTLAVSVVALAAMLVSAACASGKDSEEPEAKADPSISAHGGHQAGEPPQAQPLRPGERFVNLTMPKPYAPAAPEGGTDEYRCFMIDPKLTGQAFLTGSQFLPQNTDIVHHAIFFLLQPQFVAEAEALDAAEPGEGWRCWTDSGTSGDDPWVASWAPGANEVLFDDPNLGYAMPPGSRLVAQIHYNLLATGGQPGGSDQSSIRMRVAEPNPAMKPLDTILLPGHVELPCTAAESGPLCDRDTAVADVVKRFGPEVGEQIEGLTQLCGAGRVPAPGPTQSCDQPVRAPTTIYATMGHMHLLGRSIKIELNPGTPTARTLLDVPEFNFDDQAVRPLPEPVKVAAGDVLRVTCTHDASLRGKLPELKQLPPRYVVWGDGTADEMCLGIMMGTRS